MRQLNTLLMSFLFVLAANVVIAQEEAPLKTFEFAISVNHLKTEEQAQHIQNQVSQIPGVRDAELILVDYELTFICTNHDMNKHQIIDRVKEIIVANNAQIVTINRREK